MSRPIPPDYKNCCFCIKGYPQCKTECHQHNYDEFEPDTEKIKKQGVE